MKCKSGRSSAKVSVLSAELESFACALAKTGMSHYVKPKLLALVQFKIWLLLKIS